MVLGAEGCMDAWMERKGRGGGEMADKVWMMPGRGGVGMGVLRGCLEGLLARRRGVGVWGGDLPLQGVYQGRGADGYLGRRSVVFLLL